MQFNVKAAGTMPLPARLLGFAGLVPFAFGALAVCFQPDIRAEAAVALIVYGAVVLSFLGGIRWGFAIMEGGEAGWDAYGLSVLPSLMAWVASSIGGPDGLLILATALAVWFFIEQAAPPAIALPRWHVRLRGTLTAIATFSLAAAAVSW